MEELKAQSNYVILSINLTLPEAYRPDICAGLTSLTISSFSLQSMGTKQQFLL